MDSQMSGGSSIQSSSAASASTSAYNRLPPTQSQLEAPEEPSYGDSYAKDILGSQLPPTSYHRRVNSPPQLASDDMDLTNNHSTSIINDDEEEEPDEILESSPPPQLDPARSRRSRSRRSRSRQSASQPTLAYRKSTSPHDEEQAQSLDPSFGPHGFGRRKDSVGEGDVEESMEIEATVLHEEEEDELVSEAGDLGDKTVDMDLTRVASQRTRFEEDEDEEEEEEGEDALNSINPIKDDSHQLPYSSPLSSPLPNQAEPESTMPPSSSNIVADNLRPQPGAKKAFQSLPAPTPSNDTDISSSPGGGDDFRGPILFQLSPKKAAGESSARAKSWTGGVASGSTEDDESPFVRIPVTPQQLSLTNPVASNNLHRPQLQLSSLHNLLNRSPPRVLSIDFNL